MGRFSGQEHGVKISMQIDFTCVIRLDMMPTVLLLKPRCSYNVAPELNNSLTFRKMRRKFLFLPSAGSCDGPPRSICLLYPLVINLCRSLQADVIITKGAATMGAVTGTIVVLNNDHTTLEVVLATWLIRGSVMRRDDSRDVSCQGRVLRQPVTARLLW